MQSLKLAGLREILSQKRGEKGKGRGGRRRRRKLSGSFPVFSWQSVQLQGPFSYTLCRLAVPYLCSGPRPSPSHQPTCAADTTLNVLRAFLLTLSLGTALCVSRDGCQGNSGPVVCVNGQTGGVEEGR